MEAAMGAMDAAVEEGDDGMRSDRKDDLLINPTTMPPEASIHHLKFWSRYCKDFCIGIRLSLSMTSRLSAEETWTNGDRNTSVKKEGCLFIRWLLPWRMEGFCFQLEIEISLGS